MTDAQKQKDDLSFMQQTPCWPLWPVLPMKRRIEQADGFHQLEQGVLWAMDFDSLAYLWFPGISVWDNEQMSTLSIETGTHLNRDKLQTLLDEGWMVD